MSKTRPMMMVSNTRNSNAPSANFSKNSKRRKSRRMNPLQEKQALISSPS